MKNICFFAPFSIKNSYIGGIITILNNYIQYSKKFNSYGYYVIYDKEKQYMVKSENVINKIFFHFKYIVYNYRYLLHRANKFDIIHIHSSRELRLLDDLIICYILKRNSNIKIIVSIHRAELKKILPNIGLMKIIFMHLLKSQDMIVFLSDKTRNEFINKGLPIQKTAFLKNFHTYNNRSFFKENMNNPIRLLFVGFINKEKGIFELLKSIQKLPSNIYLDICGNKKDITTEEYKEFEKLCNKMGKQICRHGYVVGEEKENLFKVADIFVLPTYGEGLPLVLLEALHFGLPIITTPVGSIPEVLKEEENVIFVEPKNIESLVKGIERLLYNQDLWKKMSKNNSILANQYFIENNIKELCDIYNDVAKY